jgi:hypothetical protein
VTVLSGLAVRPHADRADVAGSMPFDQAVVAVNAALATETRVVEFADGWSGSVGQSRSRVLVRRLGLAPHR